ncbi:DUF1702 family protein [Naumannella halotolerans]|uniref:Uncharacterized protein DUF1702 n=1 Tax=Naumannella halotolerans TaxID=993414 RepID=A0A4R7IZG6_9ACTN|nr:DUF1702 family protein [Naumannella halotolerans]TDT30095.1 uncharacterized protein DUF1702 [Naumannella halotolerans]
MIKTILQKAKRQSMGVSDAEAVGFSRGGTPKWTHLETAVRTAVGGYHTVLDDSRIDVLVPRLEEVNRDWRGYAYEGAAMGLTGLDCFLPTKSRFLAYVEGPARHHAYMAHIGAGEALARLRRRPQNFIDKLPHPVLRWLVMDGFGFHEGFFRPDRHIIGQKIPDYLTAHARRVFDQGIGRAVWFLTGADVDDISSILNAFPAHRHSDLWLGVGVGCGYVGGISEQEIRRLQHHSGQYERQLGVGAAFVAKGRIQAGNLVTDTATAAEILCGKSAAEAAAMVDAGFAAVTHTHSPCAYADLQEVLAGWIAPTTSSTGKALR